MNGRVRVFLLWASLALLGGCGTVDAVKGLLGFGPPHAALRTLRVSADAGANQGSATLLDVVAIHDAAALAKLPGTGPEWFRQRAALQKALATGIEVTSLQVPAAYPAFEVDLPAGTRKAVAVIAFANYVNEAGWPAITLTPYKHAALRLQPDGIAVSGH
ncbi:hypothetical protein E6C76_14025 [Pseudothauera nasutitermitis]|uniref:Type VI secretion system protein n=1 Tax=Pseudothauera nasutitermitis TaxID=2565930 RepID=A0A4S4AYJ7_9RHOO|nr:hypothetical protein [Pseudothauera nasutitermitis]THF63702.1 hypothetical protein E6C76_14025 [Pseudothauera nasutitermitis]